MCKSLHASWPQCPRTDQARVTQCDSYSLKIWFQDQCSAVELVAAAGSLAGACREAPLPSCDQRCIYFTSTIQVLFILKQLCHRHVGLQFHSSLTSLYEKPTFWSQDVVDHVP